MVDGGTAAAPATVLEAVGAGGGAVDDEGAAPPAIVVDDAGRPVPVVAVVLDAAVVDVGEPSVDLDVDVVLPAPVVGGAMVDSGGASPTGGADVVVTTTTGTGSGLPDSRPDAGVAGSGRTKP